MATVLLRRSILITDATVITEETEMIAIGAMVTMTIAIGAIVMMTIAIGAIVTMTIAIAEMTDTTTGTDTTTPPKSRDSKATVTVCRLAQPMRSVAKATIRSDHTSGGTGMTGTTRVMGTEASINRCFVMHLSKATVKVTPVTVGTTGAATMDDGATAVYGPGK